MKKQELNKLIKLAESGNVVAQSDLGCHYIIKSNGEDEATSAEGIAWLQKSADGGFPPALYHLGLCYLRGNGVKADYYKAYDLFDEATNWPESIPEDWNMTEESVRSIKGSAYLNKSVTALLLGYSSSILDMVKAADLGEKHASAYLATMMCTNTQSLNTDYLTKAYEVNPVLATRIEGVFLYNNGHKEQGIVKLLEAARGGDMLAADIVVEDYITNLKIQTKEDVLLMEELLPITSLKTTESLMNMLSGFYWTGIIVERDFSKALDICLTAIGKNSVKAALRYISLLKTGKCLESPEIQEFLSTAWELIELHLDSKELTIGNDGAGLFILAEAFQNGKYGFEQNEQTALKLYTLSFECIEMMFTNLRKHQVKQFTDEYLNFFKKSIAILYFQHQKRIIKKNIKQLKKQIHGKTK